MRDYQSKLEVIDKAISTEMSRDFRERRFQFLEFLYSERGVYSQVISELNAMCRALKEEGIGNLPSVIALEGLIDVGNARQNMSSDTSLNKRIYRIATWGGIGDVFLITPALRALKRHHPGCRIYVYCITKAHEEALRNNQYVDRLIRLGSSKLKRGIYYLLYQLFGREKIHMLNYGRLAPSLFYKKNAAKIIGEMIGVEIDDPRPDCFLAEEEETDGRRVVSSYPNPVVIHVTGKCTPNKSWSIKNWEELVTRNPSYNFLQLGLPDDELVRGAVDLRGTSLRQAFGIIKAAKAFIGIDSAFAHAATALRTPAVVLFGASTPTVWGHEGNQNLYQAPRCSPCIDRLSDVPCPYGKLCMSNITVPDVERALSLSMM